MGVKGLWKLLLPIGRRISLETLRGKVLAIDASIWLIQFVKAMRDPTTGKVTAAAHIIGYFRRICRLLYHNIYPVFVFDGIAPEIKQRELSRRRQRRSEFLSDETIQRYARKLIHETLLKQKKLPKSTHDLSDSKNKKETSAFIQGFDPGVSHSDTGDTSNSKEVIELSDNDTLEDSADQKPQKALHQSEPKFSKSSRVDPLAVDETNDWDIPLAAAAMEEAKELDELERANSSGTEHDDSSENTEYEDFIPPADPSNVARFSRKKKPNPSSLSVDYISSLPSTDRKDAIETIQRQRRMQSRKEFIPAANDPVQFSNVQVSNFLKSCQLNKDIVTMAKQAAQQTHDGELMASDRTTRVELIRENGLIQSSSSTKTSSVTDTRTVSFHLHSKKSTLLESVAVPKDNDSSDSEDDDINWGCLNADYPTLQDALWNDALETKESTTQKKRRHIVIDDEDEVEIVPGDSEHIQSGVGYSATGIAHWMNCDVHNHSDGSTSPAALNQMANFVATYSSTLELCGESTKDKIEWEDGDEVSCSMKLPIISGGSKDPPSKTLAFSALAIEMGEEDPDEDVDWEDGDEASCSVKLPTISGGSKDPPSKTLAFSALAIEIGEEDPDKEVDWEDGDEANCDVDDANTTSAPSQLQNGRHGSIYHDVEIDRPEVESKSLVVSTSHFEAICTTSNTGKSAVFSEATSEALIQAQATASLLTNWAGCAFRRAITEANGGHALERSFQASSEPENSNGSDSDGEIQALNNAVSDSHQIKRSNQDTIADKQVSFQKVRMPLPITHTICSVSSGNDIPYDTSFLERNDAQWTAERNRRERDMETISDEMLIEVKQLLQLFGIPFVEAPAEAESQCAILESLGLVDGIITEDSDVFVFGGKTVYKNIFEEQKYAEVYNALDAESEMKLSRNSMVALAMLLGSDYTEGVKGVGIVNAMEILDTFDVSQSIQDGLRSFRKWLDGFDPPEIQTGEHDKNSECTPQKVKESAFHTKHVTARARWIVPQNFPADNVVKAYLDPVIDNSTDPFAWGAPDFENIIMFCQKHIGWGPEDTKRFLEPVVQTRNGKKGLVQTRIDSYMRYEDGIKFADIRSKRLRDVLGLKQESSSTEHSESKKRRSGKTSK